MGYPRKLLSQNEIVKVDLKPHWLYFFGPAAVTILALVVAIVFVAAWDSSALTWVSVILIVGAVCWLIGRFIRWQITLSLVTTK